MADNLTELTADIVSAYVAHNSVAAADLPSLIKSTFAALSGVGQPVAEVTEAAPKATVAQIRRSLTPDALISFIDGRPFRTLKRHLAVHGLTPAAYREKYGLPADYPIVAASYAAKRSALAFTAGLGRKAAPEPVGAPVEAVAAPVAAKVAAKPAKAPRASKGAAAVGEKAGPGTTVPKAKASRPKKAIDPATDEFT
jgi:predicted transcriptional regulator